jgi:hypothetical protein
MATRPKYWKQDADDDDDDDDDDDERMAKTEDPTGAGKGMLRPALILRRDEIFCASSDRPGDRPKQWVAYWVIFGGKAEGVRGAKHPPSSSAKVKESVELYLYSPSGPSWRHTSPFTDIT